MGNLRYSGTHSLLPPAEKRIVQSAIIVMYLMISTYIAFDTLHTLYKGVETDAIYL